MIDIHSHILPEVDDGAQSMEEALAMFRIAAGEGIDAIIATPHCHGHRKSASPEIVQERIVQVQRELIKEKIPVVLFAGNEIYYRQDVEAELEKGKINTLAGSPYVLVEFHPEEDYQYISRALKNLNRYGYYPVLAHVERYDNLFAQKGRIEELKKCEVQLQINASSITAKGWSNIYRKRAMGLVKERIADYIATDAHGDKKRAPEVKACEAILEKKAGHSYTQKLLNGNAEKILQYAKKKEIT